jgi:hypothetical protein
MTFALAAVVVVLALFAAMAVRLPRAQREACGRTYMFPPGLFAAFAKRRPGLTIEDRQLVAHALRQFFLASLKGGRRFVSMPSQAAGGLWHEFNLYTKHSDAFRGKAFGRFLHQSPANTLGPDRQGNAGLRRAWWHACLDQNIEPRRAAAAAASDARPDRALRPGMARHARLSSRTSTTAGNPADAPMRVAALAYPRSFR